jgi:hypothetical protein
MYEGFSKVSWTGERAEHLFPDSKDLVPGALVLCGRQVPPLEGEPGESDVEKPICRRCSEYWWKLWRTKQKVFGDNVEHDLDALPLTDAP